MLFYCLRFMESVSKNEKPKTILNSIMQNQTALKNIKWINIV